MRIGGGGNNRGERKPTEKAVAQNTYRVSVGHKMFILCCRVEAGY
jgi:hypothetical protein